MSLRGVAAAAVDWLEPRPRVVDWSLFALVAVEALTGFVSFTIGTPAGWPVVWVHRAVGLAVAVLLAFKLARVRRNLTDPGR